MKILLSYLISFGIGYMLMNLFLGRKYHLNLYLHLALSFGSGLGLSAYLTFLSYPIFGQLHPVFVRSANMGLLALLLIVKLIMFRRNPGLLDLKSLTRGDRWCMLIIAISFLLVWIEAHFYPFGGWDAWAIWNVKGKFLFSAGEEWIKIFDPVLWQSNPHYPLLLPLMNVWGWSFLDEPVYLGPLLTSMIFTLSTAGLLFGALKTSTRHLRAMLAALLLLTSPFYLKLATSQYADIIFSYFLLATLWCLVTAKRQQSRALAILGGLFLGFLSFSKMEGMVAAGLLMILGFLYLIRQKKTESHLKRLTPYFFFVALLSVVPTVLYEILWAPENQNFLNGLTSSTDPVSLQRFIVIMAAFPLEVISQKWNGLWLLIFLGLWMVRKSCWQRESRLIPMFLVGYLIVVCGYYFTNTYSEIIPFVSSTLHIVLFSLLPSMLFWIFDLLAQPHMIKDVRS